MTCEHSETTTLLWLYGEAPEEHASHVAVCAACTAVSALHADVVGGLPVVPRVAPAAPEPANQLRWFVSGTLAVAAAALVVFGLSRPPTLGDTAVAIAPIAYAEWQAPLSDLSDELDLLDAELADLDAELANL